MTAPFLANTVAGLKILGSTLGASTSVPSSRTASAVGIGNNSTDYVSSDVQASRTSGGAAASILWTGSATPGAATICQWYDSSGTPVFKLAFDSSSTCRFSYWNGSSFIAVGSSYTISRNVPFRAFIGWSGCGGGSGVFSGAIVSVNPESTVGSFNSTGLTFTSIANVAEFRGFFGLNNLSINYSEIILKDTTALASYGYANVPTSNGTDATDGTGAFSDINETSGGTFDSTFVSLPTSGNKRSFKCAARVFGARKVVGVFAEARLRCGATGPTQVKPYLLISGTRYYHASSPVTLTTSFTAYSFCWEQDPSTSADWTLATAQSANLEFGIEVV